MDLRQAHICVWEVLWDFAITHLTISVIMSFGSDFNVGLARPFRESHVLKGIPMEPSDLEQRRPTPKAFISYSWETEEHRRWVLDFATRLRGDGVDVILDQWEVHPGDQLPAFMERAVRDNDYVLIVCTPHYKDRSEKRMGGVGYEGDIMTGEVMTQNNARKFIPIFRTGSSWQAAAPGWLTGKYYIDLSGLPYAEDRYRDLLTTLHGTRPVAPPIGKRPTMTRRSQLVSTPAPPSERPAPPVFEPIRIIGIVVDEITEPRLDGTRGSALYTVPFQLSRRPSYEWAEVFIEKWNHPRSWTSMHRPGIASISGDKVYLNGTTVEKVQEYHRDTLKLAVEDANEIIAEYERKKDAAAERERLRKEEHERVVREAAKKISFD